MKRRDGCSRASKPPERCGERRISRRPLPPDSRNDSGSVIIRICLQHLEGLNWFQSAFYELVPDDDFVPKRIFRAGRTLRMPEWGWAIAFLAAYLLLTQWLLPKLGIPT